MASAPAVNEKDDQCCDQLSDWDAASNGGDEYQSVVVPQSARKKVKSSSGLDFL